MHTPIFIATDDTNLSSFIRESANEAGIPCTFFDNSHELISKCHDHSPHLIFIDLEYEHFSPMDTIKTLKSDQELDEIKIIGICKHKDIVVEEAHKSECNRTLNMDEFLSELPEILEKYIESKNQKHFQSH